MFEEKIVQLREYADKAGIPEKIMEDLSVPKARHEVKVRVRTNGIQQNFQLRLVFHCNPHSTGACPYKGGLRFHPKVNMDLLSALALDMTEKCALAELPFGGAKSGIAIDPGQHSRETLRAVTEQATEQLLRNNLLHPDVYVPGPDMGTNSDTMFWIYNKAAEWNVLARTPNALATVTGKPLKNHGCPGREDATARGLLILLSKYLHMAHMSGHTVAIQGFGNVGMNLAKLISEQFYLFKVVAVSDERGGIYDARGLDIKELIEYYQRHKTFRGYQGDRHELSNAESLLHLPVDFLIPAAAENQIRADNAGLVQAKLVIEGGNEAVTPEAERILRDKGTIFIPGIAANVGGVTVSYIEWSRNRGPRRHNVNFDEDLQKVHEDLEKIMTSIIRRMWEYCEQKPGSTLAEAAHVLALRDISERLQMKHNK